MLFLYGVLVVCCAILLISGIVEQRRHFTNLERIPTRVLINGIRGKSSITRLCAGALRGGDLVTVAKTTGTAARFIHPDATEEPVYRKFGIANVVEQIGIVRRAASYSPDALVIECMAVMPALQEINQSKLIRSTIGVLCNVREDHLAEMGPTLDDVARSLCRSMPEGGICVTAEQDRFHILQEEADARDCKLIYADPETVSDEELRGFSWFTFKENVAIALTVAELLGVDRQTALQGMYDAPPDPGVLSVERYRTHDDKRLRFANVFAANDPESTLMNINQLLDLGAIDRPLNVVINCRPDRVERNGQMGQIIPELQPEKVFVIGHPAKSAIDAIPSEWRHTAVDLGGDKRDPEEFMHQLLGHLGPESSLVAIGNIHGQGELLLEHLAELPADETPDETPDQAPDRTQDRTPDQAAPQGTPQGAPHGDVPADAPADGPVTAAFPPVPAQRQQSPHPQQPRHDETLALPRYTPHLDPYQPYPEAYEARYQQAPRPASALPQQPQPHPHQQPQQSQSQSQQHEPPHQSPEDPAEPPAPRVRGMFEPVRPPAPAQQENPGEPR
ncbi:poly-gamma-glutamate synthase PgsB [Streptomyces sp. NBC_01363]|uniref:poly-gamma-glutamate synthase PgsB n=1 Tax=Streptomyces sp. NBC_01363 TaxID=2903840 RepID=UPI002259A9DF|nr:poly-gamma-glutamate synthase PgsB [Streptomyces sp. NBC_01363]MCX4731489.1 poly-gamma-glutamate synthase PgsB [Streptomyces sp. NBC_01363]